MPAHTTSNSSYTLGKRLQRSHGSTPSQISSRSTETELNTEGYSSTVSLSPAPGQSTIIQHLPSYVPGSQTGLIIDNQSIGGSGNAHTQPRDGYTSILSSWWWWWEIGGSIVSLIGLGLIIFILKRVDDQPIGSWPYSIRPNSLIAVITTITKASMMVPIASCLSQLKWDHFQNRPNALYHLQVYDDASRGPWGCFYMISTGHLRVLSAWILALLTLAALGIEPSIQQTMEPLTRQALLRNATAQISRAGNYSSKAFNLLNLAVDPMGGATNLLRLQTMISNGAVGSIQGPNFSCPEPAVKCTWDEFDTIAVCANYTNTTNMVEDDCRTTRHDTYDNITCTFTFPEGKPADLIVLHYANNTQLQRLSTSQSCALEGAYLGCGVSPNFLNGVRVIDWWLGDDYGSFSYEAFTITLNWCIRTYHSVTASPAGIQTLNYTSSPLVYSNRSIAFPDIDPSNVVAAYHEFYSNSSTQYFYMTFKSLSLLYYVNGFFARSDIDLHDDRLNSGLSEFLYYTDLGNLTANLEETLTNQIRNSSPGDNWDGEMWPGQAFYQETYWHVHWPWVSLPIAEAVITIILLGVTIMFSRNQPLFKSSPLALLFHPLEGYEEKRFVHEMQGNGVSKLQDLAKDMRVEFKEDDDGILKFLPIEDRKCSE